MPYCVRRDIQVVVMNGFLLKRVGLGVRPDSMTVLKKEEIFGQD
jgi:hypothetical protein